MVVMAGATAGAAAGAAGAMGVAVAVAGAAVEAGGGMSLAVLVPLSHSCPPCPSLAFPSLARARQDRLVAAAVSIIKGS